MSLDLIAIRRDLHRHPETAFEENRTAAVITECLRGLGLDPRSCASTGVIADIAGANPGPTVALRADIDALPIHERTGLDYASTCDGKMHACGHDIHTTTLLGVAEQLLQRRSEISGRVRLLFQPAEEVMLGAKAMLAEGALDGVDAIFGLHNHPGMAVGTAAFRVGPLFAAADRFRITIDGVGGHGAFPHLTADPLVAGAAVITALQTAVSRATDPLEPAVVSVCRLSGGTAFNVIPDRAEMEGTVRCYSPAVRAAMPNLLRTIVEQVAAAHRCRAGLEYEQVVPPVRNDAGATTLARSVAERVLGAGAVSDSTLTMAAEDFSLYQERVPGCFFWLGSASPHALHNPFYRPDEACMEVGVRVMTEITLAAGR